MAEKYFINNHPVSKEQWDAYQKQGENRDATTFLHTQNNQVTLKEFCQYQAPNVPNALTTNDLFK